MPLINDCGTFYYAPDDLISHASTYFDEYLGLEFKRR